jgi:gamma-glutamyl hydrolase
VLPVVRWWFVMRTSVCVVLLLLCVFAVCGVSARRPFPPRHADLTTAAAASAPVAAAAAAPKAPVRAALNSRPIIGIFTLANSDDPNETGSTIPAPYVKWLEQSSARVAPIPFNAPKDELDRLFAGINGLLYTGGGLSLAADSFFFNQALYLFNKAKAANDAGDVFPIWGSCQGFQIMNLMAAQPANHTDILKCLKYDSTNLPLALDFTSAAASSQLFGPTQSIPAVMDGASLHPTIYEAFATMNLTMNLHNCGVDPADFAADPILPTFYKVLSTNVDKKGLPFVSTIEGIKYPFWAAQWHAERTQFQWNPTELLSHTAIGVSTHSYVSQRWMMLARQSQHKFPDYKTEEASLIDNFLPTWSTDDGSGIPDQQNYEFVFKY